MITFRSSQSWPTAVRTVPGLPHPPQQIHVIETIGQGRAARAQLVDATMPDGRVVRCVEKVFAPGKLTRAIYRISFQSPFAYQSNADAIAACFYRRRVAAAVLAASDIDATIAKPIYVRFDTQQRAWVLAAQWIDGRGIRPAPADTSRLRRWLNRGKQSSSESVANSAPAEIDQLVDLMRRMEWLLRDSGLIGSGWQVSPRALVSTANLLRVGERYTVIDLESGIPAVLVGTYVADALRHRSIPPFDDLDPERLKSWLDDQQRLLTFRIGPAAVENLRHDVAALIDHNARWRDSEFALLRRPWRHLTGRGMAAYRNECFRRWRQDGVVDEETSAGLPSRPLRARLIWWAGVLPGPAGRAVARGIGNRHFRARVSEYLRSAQARRAHWQRSLRTNHQAWVESGRLPVAQSDQPALSRPSFLLHWILSKITPARLHRLLADRVARHNALVVMMLLLLSSRYQSWFGSQRVEAAISHWQRHQRIDGAEAEQLRAELCGHEVLAYTRGFGMHLALKTLAPVIVPAKVGGLAAFAASGNAWFLLPMLLTPLLRTMLTLASAWTTRYRSIPHGEAILVGMLPVVGSVAFPLQMFSTRPHLSTFLIRDTASKLGRRVPVYGGGDSRTELAMIRATDLVIELIQTLASRMPLGSFTGTLAAREGPAQRVPSTPRTAFGRWLQREANRRMAESRSETTADQSAHSRAA